MDPGIQPLHCDSSADASLPTYKQVITDHPSAQKLVRPAIKKKHRAAPKKKSISNKKAPTPEVISDEDEDDPAQKVMVITSFKLFVLDADKSKKAKKVWLLISPPNPIEIEITVSPSELATTYDQFKSLVTTNCESAVSNTGRILMDGLLTGSPEINWFVSIARVEGFKKGKPFPLTNQVAFDSWIEALAKVAAKESSLSIEMTNPNKVAKLQHDAEVLAKDAARKEAKRLIIAAREKRALEGDTDVGKRKRLDGDSEDEDNESEDDVDYDKDAVKLVMRQLYATHSANAMYDRHMPVYIHPTNHSKFFLLSHGTCQKWARAITKVTAGVSLQSPPKDIKFDILPSTNATAGGKTGPAAATSTQCAHLSHSCSGRPSPPPSSDGPEPGKDIGIRDYVLFIGLRNTDEVVDLLVQNDLQNYKIFRSRNLDRPALRALGLTLGVVTQLCDSVSKFERHLAKQALMASA
ncbi:hypothetical protein PGTUg99_008783 [Puccinia graminis f. sp. tritici]|uniref:Uncharacterized protein n=1 Tax=Puccinia graminis f. sp. tritici TaxID=56615 RepID=A0A5B0LK73_PUCGR|nr:hypothetical protein PGTUg99_008783 [Puccinia graminis f. sp. tritici]